MITRFNNLFPVWAVLLSLLAYAQPTLFQSLGSLIVPLLALVMFFMGLTLRWQDFKRVATQPLPIAVGVVLQFLVMPLVAYGLSQLLALPAQLAAGLILVGCCAGGTASNVICYLAGGNVALSISMTLVSTLLGVFMTPLLCWVYISQSIEVNYLSMLLSIFKMVLLPVFAGIALNHFFSAQVKKVDSFLPAMAIVTIVFIIAIIVALNHEQLATIGMLTTVAVILHNGFGLISGYSISRFLGLNERNCRTIAIEVGMQNSGLGVALALKYFSASAALPGAVFSVWHNVSGSTLASWWQRRDVAQVEQ